MTTDALAVVMSGELMGVVKQVDGNLSFAYEDAWRFSDDATPLSVSMPLTTSIHEDGVVRAFLWGLLPDNEAVLERWGRDYGVSPRNPFALLSHVGKDCAGAALFLHPDRAQVESDDGQVDYLGDLDISALLRSLQEDPTSWHGPAATGQFSLTGAQPKFALILKEGRWGQPSGSIPTTHIFKCATGDFRELELNEHICMTVARKVGIPAARTKVATFEDQTAIVIERYDRSQQEDRWVRIHQEDLCQAFGLHPALKYQNQGGPSPGRIAELLRSVQSGDRAKESIYRFVDALIFNWIIGGTDAHAKNYSLLLSGPEVVLAPLYDVASVFPYPLDPYKLAFAMKIGHSYRLRDISPRDWIRLGDEVGVDRVWLFERMIQLCKTIPGALDTVCHDPGVMAFGSELPPKLLTTITDRAAELARTYSASA
jgi:serine/threonine-protein kinase HipA